MRTLTCHCEQTFNVDIPETVNLDNTPEVIASIADGSFLTCVCPRCNATLQTDLKTRFDWPSRKVSIVLIPEIDRFAYLSGMIPHEADAQAVIGYAELADRVAVIAAELDPVAVEAIKYHLLVKSREVAGDSKATIVFEKVDEGGNLEFRIHGIREGEIAVSKMPRSIYDTIKADLSADPDKDPYPQITNGSYISVKNILIEDV